MKDLSAPATWTQRVLSTSNFIAVVGVYCASYVTEEELHCVTLSVPRPHIARGGVGAKPSSWSTLDSVFHQIQCIVYGNREIRVNSILKKRVHIWK